MLTKPMTTGEFFNKICGILKEKGKMPEILDYALSDDYRDGAEMKTYEFNITNNLEYGDSEGIYLDMGIIYTEGGERKRVHIGTFKTLGETPDDMRTMAILLADFIIESTTYVNANIHDFEWTGVSVRGYEEDGSKGWGYTCFDMEKALARKDEMLEKYPTVVVLDNATRKEITFSRESELKAAQA